MEHIRKFVLYALAVIGVLAIVFVGANLFNSWSERAYYGAPAYERGVDRALPGALFAPSAPADFKYRAADESPLPPAQDQTVSDRKVIKNGSLDLIVDKAEDAAQAVQDIAKRHGGFVEGARVYENGAGMKTGVVTIRVPAEKFDAAFADVKVVATKVEAERVNSQDVTEQYVDLDAQLRNYRAEEEQYLDIMKRATNVSETLQVAQQLGIVRGNIERTQGQLQYLSRQIDMASITATLTAEADIELLGISWRPIQEIKRAFHNLVLGLVNFVDTLIAFVFFLPVLALWLLGLGLLAWVAWRLLRWVKMRFLSGTKVV